MAEKIELTPEELSDLEDTIKFRTKTLLLLKQLNGVPEKVTKLETNIGWVSKIVWLIIVSIIVMAFFLIRTNLARGGF